MYYFRTVLSSSIGGTSIVDGNQTVLEEITKNVAELCGANFCPGVDATVNPNLEPPHPLKIKLLAGIFLGLMICASLLVTFFADSLKRLVQFQYSFNIICLYAFYPRLNIQIRNGAQRSRFRIVRLPIAGRYRQTFSAKETAANDSDYDVHWCRAGFHGCRFYSRN